MKKPAPVFLFLLLCMPLSLWTQVPSVSFKHIGVNQGLSQSFVHCLLKDKSGFVWAGTQDGLNRFDAYQFQNFYKDKSNGNSLSNNYIWDLFQDQNDNIWIGTTDCSLI